MDSEKTTTLDDVISPDIGVGGEYIDTEKRTAPMRELPEKLVDNVKGLKPGKNTGISKSDEEVLLITTPALKKLVGERRSNEQTSNMTETSERVVTLNYLTPSNIGVGEEQIDPGVS